MNFGQIPPLTTELAALENQKKKFLVAIDRILFKIAGNEEMHIIMDMF